VLIPNASHVGTVVVSAHEQIVLIHARIYSATDRPKAKHLAFEFDSAGPEPEPGRRSPSTDRHGKR
jgi:hypothetical protein